MSNEFDPKKIIDFEKDYYNLLDLDKDTFPSNKTRDDKVKVSKIEINIDWANYFVSWAVTIEKSTDEKSYIGVATRGSIGSISSGNYSDRADSQIPTLKSQNPEYTNWVSPKIIYNKNIMATGYLEDPKKQLRQYFLAYTKA